ncbi:hypothetical protein C8A01DRAFT_44007 [Parachaetomium inaequale]|uniref:Uncharacterized protein n=1 Tax=Parachaetomium inaequale TaxID=2588326 RepID=A0AAN6SU11_9PEZI|nr:hypothetical protein C8A01DRAFT_44007 [Parachaetomium inaequale]
MRRPRFRRTSSRYSTPEHMMPIPQSPTQMSFRERDTGFPESFCGSRNTTRPHPEANLNPGACITEDDVNPARALIRHRMTFMAQQESHSRASTLDDRGDADEEGALSAFGRLAINSIRAAELRGLDAFLPSSRDGDSAESTDGMSSSDPDSPVHRGKEFDHHHHPKVDPRDAARDPRDGRRRRRGSFISRLMHR